MTEVERSVASLIEKLIEYINQQSIRIDRLEAEVFKIGEHSLIDELKEKLKKRGKIED